ncbi:MAG: shikimate dehydrogenase, partial [Gemmatimonadota bacterium]|nr:shikimate dehydrogenase [Gemmatimonadota bacterium]
MRSSTPFRGDPPIHREFVLLGSPVGHTISPRIHAAAFRVWGVDASYRAVEIAAPEVASAVARAAAAGGGNVTLPYKRDVAALLDRATPEVEATGACNCFWGTRGGAIAGDNTDVGGFIRALADMGCDPAGRPVLLLGAGGGARAVVRALDFLGAGPIAVWNRTPSRALALAADMGGRVE